MSEYMKNEILEFLNRHDGGKTAEIAEALAVTDYRSTESRGCGQSKIVELDFINLSPVVDELNTKLPESGLSGRESETGYY
ncbi:FaeA/PapI family transcriptional regulator [Escherichia coli]|uniref:FaeA/PapI family transcriptional regulator n=1 Tax=Escherichia coli TaxID=562 RepID=UPI003EDFC057